MQAAINLVLDRAAAVRGVERASDTRIATSPSRLLKKYSARDVPPGAIFHLGSVRLEWQQPKLSQESEPLGQPATD